MGGRTCENVYTGGCRGWTETVKGGGRTCEDVYIGGCRGWTETAKCLDFSIITISYLYLYVSWGHCAAGRNVVDSIPDGVTRIFH